MHAVVTLEGPVRWRRPPHGPLRFELFPEPSGGAAAGPAARIAFSCEPPQGLPERLPHVHVRRAAGGELELVVEGRSWALGACSVHVHRDVAGAFARAVPPRRVPAAKRVFWRALLALAATAPGRALLQRVRRR
jgi:hypothetical protein